MLVFLFAYGVCLFGFICWLVWFGLFGGGGFCLFVHFGFCFLPLYKCLLVSLLLILYSSHLLTFLGLIFCAKDIFLAY